MQGLAPFTTRQQSTAPSTNSNVTPAAPSKESHAEYEWKLALA